LRKPGQFQKNGGNKTRNPNNRQGNSSSGQSNQNSNSRNSSSRQPNQNANSSSRNPGGGNGGSRKKGIHPWVSSGPSSSQALTSHISMVSNRSSAEGGNGNNRNKPQGQKRRNPSHQQRDNGNNGRPRNQHNQHDKAKRNNNAPATAKAPHVSTGSEQKLTGNLDAFSLFCAYHLGIGPNKEYKASNINEVARRFGQDQGVVKQALKECNMDSAALLDKDFDMALAQLDIQVAPEGIDKMELAKTIYEDFLEAPNVKRDWKKIIEEDRKENRKVFG
jgi:hypothetical protein